MAPIPTDRAARSIEAIDRYQLVSRLGKGGMAEVFRAKLIGIGGFERIVALKVLLPSFAAEPEFVEMLLDEARIAGAIDHPNVMQVLDVGRQGDLFYLVMEYVDGHDLRTIAKQIVGGRLPLGMSLYVIGEMLRGLEAVHDARDERGYPRNIVHRDISPGNVMVDGRGFVKLGDFGIAHASGRITRTRVGAIKGKSRYMAPEQLAGTPVDHRADLYAVGVTLFEAILGDFARESSRPTIYGPIFTWPQRLPPGAMPAEVEAILRRAIVDAPEHRYRDCGEMRVDLELALHRIAPGYGPDVLARELRRRHARVTE
jgi:serine/threonine-protein kinase